MRLAGFNSLALSHFKKYDLGVASMINRISNLAVISLFIFFTTNSNASIITNPATCTPDGNPLPSPIQHSQTTLGSELITRCLYEDESPTDEDHPAITRSYLIYNNTSVPWTDYHFDLFIDDEDNVVNNGELKWLTWDNFNPSVGTVLASNRQLSIYFNNPLGVGGSFQINNLRYGFTDGGYTEVKGTPSVPVPGSLSLLALGLLSLRFSVRKVRRSVDGAIRKTTM
jgi:hypothetical protein